MDLRTPICESLGIEYPIFLAGMGGVAYADVCAAVSEAGGFGTLGMAAEGPERIREEMRKVRALTDRPFGVDLLAALPDSMMRAIDVIIAEGARVFVAGLGVPGPIIKKCHDAGLQVWSMCGKVSHAVAAEQAGCDVVVAQGTEAGGHTGQIAGMALIPQIVDAVSIPVLAAGSIVDGRGLAAALAFGAQGVWMGTRFIASHEARAHETYKKRITEIDASETRVTKSYSGKPMRVIRNAWTDDWERRPQDIKPFPEQMRISGENMVLLGGPGDDLDAARACMPCGQGAGAIKDIPSCAEIIQRTLREARETIARLGKLAGAENAARPSPARSASRSALVLAGGGARGAYEAGVLAHLFEHVLPRLPEGRRLDLFSGTSVGAIHAAYAAASAHWDPIERAGRIAGIWKLMRADEVFQLSVGDLVRVPLRALGMMRAARRESVLGGLVDIRPLEHLVATRIPWDALPGNLASGAVGALCISCTEIRSGRVTVFMDGPLADPSPWKFDPGALGIGTRITERHVRASAAIPFLFPAVRLGDRFYVDGGLRMNTPLSPALRLGADRVLVVATKQHEATRQTPNYPDEVITQPSFLLGKVLDALTLDQLEVELRRAELVNAMIERGTQVYGEDFLDRINVAVREQRGVGFRKLRTCVIRPSEDIGRIAADVHREGTIVREVGLLHDLLVRMLARGGPEDEADLLSYVFFDKRFTERLVEMGRADARTHEAEVFALLSED